MPELGKTLLILGGCIAAVGLALIFWDKLPFSKLPLGRLPGDINVQKPGFSFHFPWMTCLIISVVVSVLLGVFRK